MRDTEVVATIVAGDPDGLAAAYDRYADSLYTYDEGADVDTGAERAELRALVQQARRGP